MTRSAKKERERLHLRLFQQLFQEAPSGDASSPEPPGFLFARAGRPLGIELTEYHGPPAKGRRPEQEQDSLLARVVQSAQRAFTNVDTRQLSVSVLFRSITTLNKKDVGSLAAALATKVHLIETVPWKQVRLDGWQDDLPEPITTIFVTEVGIERPRLWQHVFAALVRFLSPVDIQNEILKKERNFDDYPPDLHESWLVIVVHHENSASFAEPTPETLAWNYESRFDRVFLLDTFRRSVWEFLLAPR